MASFDAFEQTAPGLQLPEIPSGKTSYSRAQSSSRLTGFPKEYWLTPRTALSEHTPIATINRFCLDHGFQLWELGASSPYEQRWALYKLLEKHGWPVGYEAYMRALKVPRQPRPPPNVSGMEERKKEIARSSSRGSARGMSVPGRRAGTPGQQFPHARTADDHFLMMSEGDTPYGRATTAPSHSMSMESLGGSEPMDALVNILKHQTSITERWQQMLMEQSESTKYLQRINVDNAKLVRDQVEATQRLVEMERQNPKPSSPREPESSSRRRSSRRWKRDYDQDDSRSASDDEPTDYGHRERRYSRSSPRSLRDETLTAMQREMRELRALMEQSTKPPSNSKSEVNALRDLITSLQVELAQKSSANSDDPHVSAIKEEISHLRTQLAASGENRASQAEQEKQRLKEELERLRAEASSREMQYGQASMQQEMQLQQQQQSMQMKMQMQQQELENVRQRMAQEKAEMEMRAKETERHAQAELERLRREAESEMRSRQAELDAQRESIRLRAEAAEKAKQEAEMRAQQAQMESEMRLKQAELDAQRQAQQAAFEAEQRAKQAEQVAQEAMWKAQQEAEQRAKEAEMKARAEAEAAVAAARAQAEAAAAAQAEAARKAEEEARAAVEAARAEAAAVAAAAEAAAKARREAEEAAEKARQEEEMAAAKAEAEAAAAAAKAKEEAEAAAAEAARKAEEEAQQAAMRAQKEAEEKARKEAEAAAEAAAAEAARKAEEEAQRAADEKARAEAEAAAQAAEQEAAAAAEAAAKAAEQQAAAASEASAKAAKQEAAAAAEEAARAAEHEAAASTKANADDEMVQKAALKMQDETESMVAQTPAPAEVEGALADDLPPPKPPPPPPPDEMPGASCPALNHLASTMGVGAPSGKSWLSMFCDTVEQLPHAVAITDMQTPGLPVTFANSAMVALTGYAKDAIEGRNCRFLQGKKSEAAAVRAMVSAIRGTKMTTVKITNYRKDGKTFVNVLSLIPVKDSTGQYRYNVGILSDAKQQSSEKVELEKLRGAIPREFDAKLQPKRFDESLTQVDSEAQKKQWKQSMIKFTRLLWSADWETSLLQVVRNEGGLHFFGKWLASNAPTDATQLEMWVYAQQVAAMAPEQQGPAAIQMCQQLMGSTPGSAEEAVAALQQMASQALSVLSRESFPRFVQSKACLPLVEQLIGSQAEELKKADDVIWSQYTVPPDCAGWIHSFASVARAMPACIVISDMAMPGNPMFFVNDEFCRVTGYERTEAQGRNCRFLQGPRTEPQSVAVIQDTLRRGVDCHVKITNYRKSGELFENLLTMRPVHDSNGVYRFCIGVQFEVTRDTNLKSRLAKLDKLIKLLPATLEVSSKAAVGLAHKREETEEETQTALTEKLTSALEGNTVGPDNQVLQDSDYFAENHKEMLQHIGVVPKDPETPPDGSEAASAAVVSTSAPPRPVAAAAGAPLADDLPPPKPPPPPPPDEMPGASCPALNHLASTMGVGAPSGKSWLSMFCDTVEQLPHAVAITDMQTPGLPVTFANSAMVALTGYAKDAIEGRNCRFLQGKKSEAAAVRAMVSAIRGTKMTTVKITNYRKDGKTFVNVLSLIPVKDSTGQYRYNVGILSDAKQQSSEKVELEKLRGAIPREFDAKLQPKRFDESLTQVDSEAQKKQWKQSMIKFTRLLWSADWETSLLQVVRNEGGLHFFGKWLASNAPTDATQLEMWVYAQQVAAMAPEQQGPAAIQMCQQLMGSTPGSAEEAVAALQQMASQALSVLSRESFPRFVQSKACLPLVEQLIGSQAEELKKADDVIWSQYTVPPDCAGWIHSFASVARAMPACIVISDMAMPGNPMFFVNDEFCRVTGYERTEAQGRNCRFLQGPRTEPQSVAVIQDTLRRGVDCHVKITNYRKSGELFENLLTMRPVHDSNGVYRFCIGVQFEVTRDTNLKSRLAKLDKLIKLLPATLEVSSKAAVGLAHKREETEEETQTALTEKLTSALEGNTVGPDNQVLQDSDYFAENHKEMLQHIGVVPKDPETPPDGSEAASAAVVSTSAPPRPVAAAAGAPLADDLPPPKPPPPPPPDEMPGASCPALNHLASTMGVGAPSGKSWLSMFCDTVEQLPHAVAITDMQTPGLPVTFANSAMVALTGYAKDAIEGRNCRFLQGKKSEAAAVRAMVSAIRGTKMTTVKITNYRKDGKTFVNVLSLIPVKDSTGQYRYNVGILSDAKQQSSEKVELEKLRDAIPREFDAKLQPKRFDESLTQVDSEAQKKQWKQSMIKFTRLLWSADWETSLLQVVRNEGGLHFFGKWLASNAPTDATQLEMWVYAQQVAAMAPEQQGPAAIQMCQQLMGSTPGSAEEAVAALQQMASQALSVLSRESFPRFVQSKACLPLVEQLIGSQAEELKKADDVIWSQYTVPPDCAGWIHSFASVARAMPACIVISDMAMPGNPMFFVNDEFCRVTGYERTEAQGRNCRFLQGPRTEPQSVAVIQDTLRRGVDCHVKITNYRKSGELFENLLTMRPVHDSNGVYRFCIGVQFEVTRDTNLKSRLAKLDKLIKLLPATLEVSSKAAVGLAHKREETEEETQTALTEKLTSALEGNTVGPDNQVLQDSDYFAENHKEMLQHIGVVEKDPDFVASAV